MSLKFIHNDTNKTKINYKFLIVNILQITIQSPCGSPSKKRNSHYDYSSFCISFIIPLRFHSSPFAFQSSEDFILIVPSFAFSSSYYYISILPIFRSAYLTIHCKSDMLQLLERMIAPQITGQMME